MKLQPPPNTSNLQAVTKRVENGLLSGATTMAGRISRYMSIESKLICGKTIMSNQPMEELISKSYGNKRYSKRYNDLASVNLNEYL